MVESLAFQAGCRGFESRLPLQLSISSLRRRAFTGGFAMKRVGFLLKVRRDMLDEYKDHHRNVWPEMLDALRRNGWRNYSLFAREDGLLFGYFEAEEDFQAALEGMSSEDANARWQEFMAPYFEIPPGAKPDQMMQELEEVFHTD